MNPPSADSSKATTFVVRFWREWSEGQPRWRGRVEHVESRQQASFLDVEDLVAFFGRFGIDSCKANDPTKKRSLP
jgi:hypothetical protein